MTKAQVMKTATERIAANVAEVFNCDFNPAPENPYSGKNEKFAQMWEDAIDDLVDAASKQEQDEQMLVQPDSLVGFLITINPTNISNLRQRLEHRLAQGIFDRNEWNSWKNDPQDIPDNISTMTDEELLDEYDKLGLR